MNNVQAAAGRCRRLGGRGRGALAGVALLAIGFGTIGAGATRASARSRNAALKAHSTSLITASNGIKIVAHPTRIVSLSPASTDDLYDVGAGGQVIAVDRYSTYPSSAPKTGLDGWSPNAEAIAKYRPDLVIVYNDNNSIEAELAKLKIPVMLEPAPTTLTGAYAQLSQLGRVTGHATAGAKAANAFSTEVWQLASAAIDPGRTIKVYMELYEPGNCAATSKTFAGRILALMHLRNIADGGAGGQLYPFLSDEYIVTHDPQLIITTDSQSYSQVAARPAWSATWAVRHHDVYAVADSVGSEWGPHAVLPFLKHVAAAVEHVNGQL